MSERIASVVSPSADPASARDGPYIGLRPFRASQRRLMYGRDRDAQLLRQKIYSSRLTLLYAPSGVGKTSLLSALVIPSLEAPPEGDEGAVVVSFEHWQADQPMVSLKQRIADTAAAVAGRDDPLGRVLVAAQRACAKSLVIVLDQFEQLLIGHPDLIDGIGRELGQALQVAEGCHIVIALREEFLASLHPLREHVPALMSSTYRLEHLAGPAARAAITKPAAAFSASVETALVEALVEDLRADTRAAAGVLTVPPPGAVELPFLQLICRTLWAHSDRRQLTLDLYRETLGGRRGIIQRYLNEVVAGLTAEEQDQAARILHRLAPQSGVKKLYLPGELASEIGLPLPVVSKLLDHFATHSVLRTRDTGGAIGYELHHDAFTAVLRPWIDARLGIAARRARARQRAKVAGLALMAAGLALVFIWPVVQSRARVSGSVNRAMESFSLGQEAAAQAEWASLAGYLTARNQPGTMIGLLREHRQFVPRRGTASGMSEVLPEALAQEMALRTSGTLADDPGEGVTIRVSPERPIDAVGMHYAWRVGASRLMATSGLPVPLRIRIAQDSSLSIDAVSVQTSGSGSGSLVLSAPSRPDHIVLIDEDLRLETARAALEELQRTGPEDVEEILAGDARLQGWYVPYWTEPLWTALGVRIWPEESGIVLAATDRVVADAGLVLDAETVTFLLNRTRAGFCETVAEAESARGGIEGIRRDLIAIVGRGASIGDLPDVLDALAAFPASAGSDAVAAVIGDALAAGRLPTAPMPPEKHIARVGTCAGEMQPPDPPSRLQGLLFPPLDTHVHVGLGAGLAQSFDAAVTRNQRAFRQAVTRIRRDIYRGFGIDPPEVADPAADRDLAARQFSVVLPGRWRQRHADVIRPGATQEEAGEAMARLLAREMSADLGSFIKADAVAAALAELPAGIRDWLRQSYSLTDLKILLRSVIAPTSGDAQARAPERTLAHLPWLLGSLTFWTAACEPRDELCLVEGLLSSQRARIAASNGGASQPAAPAAGPVSAAILELRNERMGTATDHFMSAVRADRSAAVGAFTAQWALLARPIQGFQLTRVMSPSVPAPCGEPHRFPEANGPISLREAWEIEDYLDARQAGDTDEEDHLRLGLCLLRANLASEDPDGTEAAWLRLARDPGKPESWSVDAQLLAGRLLLDAVRQTIIADTYLADSRRLLAAALTSLTDEERADMFVALTTSCEQGWLTAMCVAHLASIEAAVPDSFWLPFQLGLMLSGRDTGSADAEAALRLLDKAESRFPQVPREERSRLSAWMLYGRASALSDVARERPEQAEVSRQLYQKLLDVLGRRQESGWPEREQVHFSLLLLDVFDGRIDRARRIFDAWSRESPDTVGIGYARVFLMLESGDEAGLQTFARIVAADEDADTDSLFVASVAAIASNSLDRPIEAMVRRYLDTNESNRDYLRLFLSWRLDANGQRDAARALIHRRWSRVDPDSWSRRLQRGDVDVWAEMLTGYFHGSLQRVEIFADLASEEEYRGTPLSRMGRAYRTVLTEAHFYDALVQGVRGDTSTRASRMKGALEQAVELRDVRRWDYYLARYLLRSMAGCPDRSTC